MSYSNKFDMFFSSFVLTKDDKREKMTKEKDISFSSLFHSPVMSAIVKVKTDHGVRIAGGLIAGFHLPVLIKK